jgi:hypothetical protein
MLRLLFAIGALRNPKAFANFIGYLCITVVVTWLAGAVLHLDDAGKCLVFVGTAFCCIIFVVVREMRRKPEPVDDEDQ